MLLKIILIAKKPLLSEWLSFYCLLILNSENLNFNLNFNAAWQFELHQRVNGF
jgi:hypothetical protein